MNPLVSVIVPTFDGEPFLVEALESILAQDYRPLEVVVCDDGSTDGTVGILRSFGDRIRLMQQPHAGLAACRNRAAAAARGALLAFLDQDDRWEPGMLAVQVRRLREHPDCGLVYADSWVIDRHGTRRGRRGRFLDYAAGEVFTQLLSGNFIPIETLVLRADLFSAAGGFRQDLGLLEDYELCLRLARTTRVGFTPEPLASYRVHERNLSHDIVGVLREYVRILEELSRSGELAPTDRAIVERQLGNRYGELAWQALRRIDLGAADRWLGKTNGHSRWSLQCKNRALRALARVLPRDVFTRLVAALPRRRLYGVAERGGRAAN